MIYQKPTVIFVHSTAHWEAIQQQRAELLGVPPTPEVKPPKKTVQYKKEPEITNTIRSIGKEGSRRRQRWTNNHFTDHPNAVLYAEDLRPPGYENKINKKLYKKSKEILSNEEEIFIEWIEKDGIPQPLPRHTRHDLKKLHISQGLVTNYESQLLDFIDTWLDDPTCLEQAHIRLSSNNQFERYVLHTMCRYYGFYSFSETNEENIRITSVCHPAYMNYIKKQDTDSIDYSKVEDWIMPERSFYDYLYQN